LSRVFKLEVPSSLGSSSIYQRWIAENLAVIWPMEVFEWVNENFLNNYEFWKGAKMLARGRLSEKIFFAYFVFRGSIGIYQSVQTSRIVKKFINQCTLLYTPHATEPTATYIPSQLENNILRGVGTTVQACFKLI
jgi:hypothetical protein